MQEVGLLQATVDAIGEADNEIGGFRQTRVTALTRAEAVTPDSFEWSGGTLVSYQRNPTEMTVLPWIRLGSDGRLFEVTGVTSLGGGDYRVDVDLAGATAPQTVIYSVTGTGDYNGTLVTLTNPEEVPIGGWIRATGDSNWFEVVGKSGSTVTIANPHSFTIPSGVTTLEYSPNPAIYIVTDEIEVESVLNWPDAGLVAIDGMLYEYTSKSLSPMKLEGITHFDASQEILGLAQDHFAGAVVTDVTRDSSALELTRSAMLVQYADGEDLNVVGRNVGVLRYPFLQSDDVFREIIKAIAYNPRGTMFGLELALDAMVGEGNYELYEDLVNHPCTVFIRITGGVYATPGSAGKAYLTGAESIFPTSQTTLTLGGSVVNRGAIYSVRLQDQVGIGDFRNAKPSGVTPHWTYNGTGGSSEAVNVILTAGVGVRISHVAASDSYYWFRRHFQDQYTDWSVDLVMSVPTAATLSTNSADNQQLGVQVYDGEHGVCFGLYQNSGDSGKYWIVLTSVATIVGTPISLNKDTHYAVQLRKQGELNGIVDLWIDGNLVDRQKRVDFTTVLTARRIYFGILKSSAPTTVLWDLSSLSFGTTTPGFDFWNYYEDAAVCGAPNTVTIFPAAFIAGDVGKRLEVSNSGVTNPYGGNNNGRYVVSQYNSGTQVEVEGAVIGSGADFVGSTYPRRIIVDPQKHQFEYPTDLGKEIVVLDSTQGNNGTYIIEKLLDPNTLVNLAAWQTPLIQKTNVCEILEPVPLFSFVAESGVSYRVDPVFVNGNNHLAVLSDAGSESGGSVTLRQQIDSIIAYVDVYYSQVLSALILFDITVKNVKVQLLPEILWQYYPFYISDPTGYISHYIDDLTAAGVIPELSVE
jgi:hypothetical protein